MVSNDEKCDPIALDEPFEVEDPDVICPRTSAISQAVISFLLASMFKSDISPRTAMTSPIALLRGELNEHPNHNNNETKSLYYWAVKLLSKDYVFMLQRNTYYL